MNELALFAGAGGGILGGHLLGWRTVCAVEYEPYAAAVLIQRQNDGILPPFPIWDDVRTFDGKPWRGIVDVVSGGFPCQDISSAGRGDGIGGERSGLWGEMARIVREVRPRFVFVENSPMLTIWGLGTVLGDLSSVGFDARWGVVPATYLGAPHARERIWIVADAEERSCNGKTCTEDSSGSYYGADISGEWNDARSVFGADYLDFVSPDTAKRESQSGLCLVVDGVAHQMDELSAIGNGQVPAVAAAAWRILRGGDLT